MNQRGEIPRLYYLIHSITQEERLDYSSLIWPLVFCSSQATFSPELILTPSLVSSIDYIHFKMLFIQLGKKNMESPRSHGKKHCVCSGEGAKNRGEESVKKGIQCLFQRPDIPIFDLLCACIHTHYKQFIYYMKYL